MEKQVIWSLIALKDRDNIFEYWDNRNQSLAYSLKLENSINEAIEMIKLFPKIGRYTDDKLVRIVIVHGYQLYYEVVENTIYILRIWDTRQDPEKLKY